MCCESRRNRSRYFSVRCAGYSPSNGQKIISSKKKIMMASKGWKVVQAHVPMIRFRKGGAIRATAGAASPSQSAAPGAAPKSSSGSTGPHVIALPVIEDFQLPLRFQRRPIDPKEIEYINRGGPE